MKNGGADTLKPVAAARRAKGDKQDARREAVSAFVVWQRQRDTTSTGRLTFPSAGRLERAAERS
jgi:hypothetical protein